MAFLYLLFSLGKGPIRKNQAVYGIDVSYCTKPLVSNCSKTN